MTVSPGRNLRLGLIGAGRFGQAYIRTIGSMEGDGIVLARVATLHPDRIRNLVPSGCELTPDWENLVAAGDLDGVIVATPTPLHASMAERVMLARIPLMIEKPLTLDLAEAERLLKVCAEQGGKVLVDHTHLFHPGYGAMKAAAAGLGPARFLRSTGGNWGPFRADTPPLWDYGSHDIALILDFAGRVPATVHAVRNEKMQVPEGYGEVVSVDFGFDSGFHATATFGNLMRERQRRFEAHFEDQVIVLDEGADPPWVLVRHSNRFAGDSVPTPSGPGVPMPIAADLPLSRAVRTFVAGIRGKSDQRFGLDLAVRVVRVLASCETILRTDVTSGRSSG